MSDAIQTCFRGTTDSPTSTSINSNLTTCLYQTSLGVAAITWCRNIIGHGLRIDLYLDYYDENDQIHINNIASFRLYLKPWLFWKKRGSQTLHLDNDGKTTTTRIDFSWDLSKAKFLSGPEPTSSFYVAIVVDKQMLLLVGDSIDQAYIKTRALKPSTIPALVMRREHVFGNKAYITHAKFGGKTHEISIEYTIGSRGDPRISFSIDRKRVLQVKRLKWKFRGNERIHFDGVPLQLSWDVYNWLFDDVVDGHAVFMFRFERKGFEDGESVAVGGDCNPKGMILWQPFGLGMKGLERKKMKKSLLKTRSSSSSSSASSGGSSSVMEWASMEENELQSSPGFSLLIYAWKR